MTNANTFRTEARPRFSFLGLVDAHPVLSLAVMVACIAGLLTTLVLA